MMIWLGLFGLASTTLELRGLVHAAGDRREAMASLGAERMHAAPARSRAAIRGLGR